MKNKKIKCAFTKLIQKDEFFCALFLFFSKGCVSLSTLFFFLFSFSCFLLIGTDVAQAVPITGENFRPVHNAGFLEGSFDYHFIPQLIKFLLIIAELASIGVFIYHGATFIFASGEDQKYTNARNGMFYALTGIVFIAAAYALVEGVIKLEFFNR